MNFNIGSPSHLSSSSSSISSSENEDDVDLEMMIQTMKTRNQVVAQIISNNNLLIATLCDYENQHPIRGGSISGHHKYSSSKLSTTKSLQKKRWSSIEQTKMSWQAYVDDHLMCDIEGNRLAAAAIIGHNGDVWAQSDAIPQLKPEEIEGIMKDFDEPGHLAPTGLFLGGTKYMVIQGEPNAVIRGKKGSGGVSIKKTNLALVIGIYEEPLAPGQCNMIVERLGDYLYEQGL